MDGATRTDDASLEALRDVFRHHSWATLQLIDYCAGLTPEQLSEWVPGTRGPILETLPHIVRADWQSRRKIRPEPETPHARNLLLIQAVHHGNDHRTQICTVLGSKGLAVWDLDCWAYWASERISR